MGPFPLETERLVLREYGAEDEEVIHAYGSDAEVTRYTAWGPNQRADTTAFLKLWLAKQESWPRDAVSLAIKCKADGRLIGGIGIEKTESETRTGVFGYVLQRDYWGRGFATEAARELLHFSFSVLGLHRIVAQCDTRNAASFHVMEKLGMRREGYFRKDALKHGEWRDTYLYAVLKEEWGGRKLRVPGFDCNSA